MQNLGKKYISNKLKDVPVKLKCPICNSYVVKPYENLRAYLYCLSCHTAQKKLVRKITYDSSYYTAKSTLLEKFTYLVFIIFYNLRQTYVGKSKKNLWIDIGAGDGKFLKNTKATHKLGVESSREGRKLLKIQELEVISDRQFRLKKELNADVISLWHVLEHTNKPWLVLKTSRKNIAKNGKLIVAIPNIDSADFFVFGKNWFHLAPSYHIWHFSMKSITILLEKSGFKIDKVDYWAPEHHLTGILQSFVNISGKSNNILHKLVKRKTNLPHLKTRDLFSILFWITLGLPIVFLFWVLNSIIRKSGAVVIVASPSNG